MSQILDSSGNPISSGVSDVNNIDVANHPFTKEAAIELVKDSPLNSWMKGVCLSRISDADFINNPRLLMMKILEYVEINLKEVKKIDDVLTICALCKFTFKAKNILLQQNEVMECNSTCDYYSRGYATKSIGEIYGNK